jgi:hypothetical protein
MNIHSTPPPAVHPTRVPEKMALPGIEGTTRVPLNIEYGNGVGNRASFAPVRVAIEIEE